jgi:hypothetical protein
MNAFYRGFSRRLAYPSTKDVIVQFTVPSGRIWHGVETSDGQLPKGESAVTSWPSAGRNAEAEANTAKQLALASVWISDSAANAISRAAAVREARTKIEGA